MNLENEYKQCLEENTRLSPKSITNYIGGLKTLQRDLMAKVIEAQIFETSNISEILKYKESFDEYKDIADHRYGIGKGMYQNSWKHYIDFLNALNATNNLIRDLVEIEEDYSIKTEKKTYIEARIGQGKYKRELVDLWKCCSLSGYANISFLIGSHIKPWSKCENNFEKLDKYNGLLLTPNLDKLFDNGYISFEENGKMIVSKVLTQTDLDYLNVKRDSKIEFFEKNLKYLKFHREEIFKK